MNILELKAAKFAFLTFCKENNKNCGPHSDLNLAYLMKIGGAILDSGNQGDTGVLPFSTDYAHCRVLSRGSKTITKLSTEKVDTYLFFPGCESRFREMRMWPRSKGMVGHCFFVKSKESKSIRFLSFRLNKEGFLPKWFNKNTKWFMWHQSGLYRCGAQLWM